MMHVLIEREKAFKKKEKEKNIHREPVNTFVPVKKIMSKGHNKNVIFKKVKTG